MVFEFMLEYAEVLRWVYCLLCALSLLLLYLMYR